MPKMFYSKRMGLSDSCASRFPLFAHNLIQKLKHMAAPLYVSCVVVAQEGNPFESVYLSP